jgi:hypothetical protein
VTHFPASDQSGNQSPRDNVAGVSVAQIRGDRSLPSGYRHPHASEQARQIATDGMILRVQVGSGVHGITIDGGNDDRDEMGICLEPIEHVVGLARVPSGLDRAGVDVPFEQYERHTAWDREAGVRERYGVGDLDVIVYSARKWARLALAGNPTVLLPLFTPDEETMYRAAAACELVDNAHRFVSKRAADRFLGYLDSQRRAMTGESGAHTNRPELVAIHGFDTKFAAHALRLGIQGIELLTLARINLPMLEEHRDHLRAVRRGEVSLQHVLSDIARSEDLLTDLRSSSTVPDEPDRLWVDHWLIASYQAFWHNQ